MRLCFNGFCLGPRPSAVEQSTQTALCSASALDTLSITTFFNKSATIIDNSQLEPKLHTESLISASKYPKNNTIFRFSTIRRASREGIDKIKMIDQEEMNFQNNNSANNSTMFDSHISDNSNATSAVPSQIAIDPIDAQNNNHFMSSSSQLELVSNDSLGNTVDGVSNIFINDCLDVNMQEMEADLLLTPKEKDLIKIIHIKDVRIKELEEMVCRRDDQIANLKSHLDKFQSVFPFRSGGIGTRKIGRGPVQRQRAQGISAEPQSESMHELLNVAFSKYEKDER